MHFCVYSNLTFSYDLAHKIKSSIIFFKALISVVVYLLVSFYFIVLFNNDFNKSLLNILLNLFAFITFQFCLKRRISFFCALRFSIVLINK